MSNNDLENKEIINQIEKVIKEAQSYVVSTVNMVLLKSYLRIGDIISSSKSLTLRELEKELKPKYGEGFSFSEMSRMIKFSQIYSVATLWQHLNWSHYKLLITIKDDNERQFYGKCCNDSLWSVRELSRQIKSSLYERVLLGEIDNPTHKNEINKENDVDPIGIVLCQDKDDIQVEYALGSISNQIFVRKYLTQS